MSAVAARMTSACPNVCVLERLLRNLPHWRIATTAALVMDPDSVEAITFAWLAKQTLDGRPGNLAAVTGAVGEGVLGAIYLTKPAYAKKREPQLPFFRPFLLLNWKKTIRSRRCWSRSDS